MRRFSGITQTDVDNEFRAVKKLCLSSHPNIVQIYQLGLLKKNEPLYFIDMELCDFTLEHYLRGAETVSHVDSLDTIRSEGPARLADEIYSIAEDITNGLIFIHGLGEVHRDLSPQNGSSRIVTINLTWRSTLFFKQKSLEDRGFWTHIRGCLESLGYDPVRQRQIIISRS